jgi:four helix bundle protein
MQYSFENLEVWKDTQVLVRNVYDLTKRFPDDEKFCLVNQMRRAVISVSSNIAEGSSKDQAHFYQLAYSSLTEVLSQLILCKEFSYITDKIYIDVRSQLEKVSNKLNALRKSRLKNV